MFGKVCRNAEGMLASCIVGRVKAPPALPNKETLQKWDFHVTCRRKNVFPNLFDLFTVVKYAQEEPRARKNGRTQVIIYLDHLGSPLDI